MTVDACDHVVVSGPVEASAYGNVMLQAMATGHLRDVKAGRASMAESVQCISYFPQPNSAWDEAFMLLERMRCTVCG